MQIWRESLEAMLEYWYSERDPLKPNSAERNKRMNDMNDFCGAWVRFSKVKCVFCFVMLQSDHLLYMRHATPTNFAFIYFGFTLFAIPDFLRPVSIAQN